DANGVDPVRGHLDKVPLDDVQGVELVAACIGPKCSIADAPNVELRVAREDEFASHMRPGESRAAARHARVRTTRRNAERRGHRPVVFSQTACQDMPRCILTILLTAL